MNYSPDEIIKNLVNKIQSLQTDGTLLTYHSSIKINRRQKAVVFKIDCSSHEQLINKRFINIGLHRVFLLNFTPLIQCHKCARFGHMDHCCWFKCLACPNCAGKHHLKECDSPLKRSCINCTRKGLDANHSSWDKICPVRSNFMQKRVLNNQRNHNSLHLSQQNSVIIKDRQNG